MDKDITEQTDADRLKELVRRTGEFIAYFELAETKMLQWQYNIDQTLSKQDDFLQQQVNTLNKTYQDFNEILTQAGAARWRLAAENSLSAGKEHLTKLNTTSENMLNQLETQQQDLQLTTQTALSNIEQTCQQTLEKINHAAQACNLVEFKEIADNYAEKIERTTNESLNKRQQLIKSMQFKTAMLAIVASSISALTIGLYMSDEMPWEIHKHAWHERNAGKALLNAWPNLTVQEREKIIAFNQQKSIE